MGEPHSSRLGKGRTRCEGATCEGATCEGATCEGATCEGATCDVRRAKVRRANPRECCRRVSGGTLRLRRLPAFCPSLCVRPQPSVWLAVSNLTSRSGRRD